MSEDMKLIMTKLNGIGEDISELKQDVKDMKVRVSNVEVELCNVKEDLYSVKENLGTVKEDLCGVKEDVHNVKADLQGLKLIVENDVSRKINVIAEGHSFLWEKLEEARNDRKDRERLALEVIALRADMRQVKAVVGIA